MTVPTPINQDQAPVLAAVDFSEVSNATVLAAARAAAVVGARLHLVHVIHDHADAPGFYRNQSESDGPMRPIDDLAREMGERFLATLRGENPELQALADAELTMIQGLPVTRILEVSESLGASLLVIGSSSDSVRSTWLHASLGERLANRSVCPVVAASAKGGVSSLQDNPVARHWVEQVYGRVAA